MLKERAYLIITTVLLAAVPLDASGSLRKECESDLLFASRKSVSKLGEESAESGRPPFQSEEYFTLAEKWGRLTSNRRRLIDQLSYDANPNRHRYDDDYVPLTDGEKQQKREEISEITAALEVVGAALQLQERTDHAALVAMLKARLQDASWAPLLRDHLRASGIQHIPSSHRVTVLVGDAGEGASAEDLALAARLVQGLAARGYTVLYDAEATSAARIADAGGENAIGIAARSRTAKLLTGARVVHISNDYLRMKILGSSAGVFTDRHSLTGNALIINGDVDALLDTSSRWGNGLASWTAGLNEDKLNLGTSFRKLSGVKEEGNILGARDEDGDLLLPGVEPKAARAARDAAFDFSPEMISREELEGVFDYAHSMLKGGETLGEIPAGAAVFGSSRLDRRVNRKVFEVVKALGELAIPVVTGGSGGMMLVSNTAAMAAGVPSVGIPIRGRNSLASEKETFRDIQTHTVPVPDYSSRIPLLLADKELVVLAPGGSGTMKELAVLLIKFVGNPEQNTQVMLIDRTYYGELFDWIHGSGLAQSVKDRFQLVDSAEEARSHVRDLIFRRKVDPRRLQLNEKPVPHKLKSSQLEFLNDSKKKKGKR